MAVLIIAQIAALIIMAAPLAISIINTRRNKPVAVLAGDYDRETIRTMYPDCFAYKAINGKWYVWRNGEHAMDHFNTTRIK